MAPTKLDINIASASATPIHPEIAKASINCCPLTSHINTPVNIKEIEPTISPLKKPTRISLNTNPSICLNSSSSSIKTLIVTARDWVPTLPDIPRITDWNVTIIGSPTITFSNILITVDTIMPSISNMISHGTLFLRLWDTLSCKSSSSVKPANLA